MKFTDEQQNALDARGRVLVSAAAGSGKTAVLVEKVINLICDEKNPVDIDKLLIVTYTNAAAAEMKTRISKRLSEKIKEQPDNFNLKRQKLLLSSASIGTIDSYCITLCKEYFYKLGIDCDFKIADASVISKVENACIDELLAEKFENPSKEFLDLVSVFGGESADQRLKENILKVYEYFCTLPFPRQYVEKVLSMYKNFDEDSVIFDVTFEYAHELVENAINSFSPAYQELLNEPVLLGGYGTAFAEVDSKLKRALDFIEKRDYNSLRNMLEHYSNVALTGIKNYPDKDFCEKMKAAKTKAEETFPKLKKNFNCSLSDVYFDAKSLLPLIEEFFNLTLEFSERLSVAKKENNALDFSDIEKEGLNLLLKYEDGEFFYTDEAKELSNKFHAVFVDEYQDTNDLQNEIFRALSDDGKKLFMVGDVKQSIYGFRKANPRNFLKSRNELPIYQEGSTRSKVIMSGNFRSSEDVCHFVNFLFHKLLTDKCGEMFYEKEDMLIPLAKFLPVEDDRVNLDIITETNEELSSTKLQGYHIANIIKEKIGKNCITENDVLRPAEYKDVCILVRDKKVIPELSEAFREKNIPIWVDSNAGLLEEREIVTLFSLLKVIDNPYEDIPLLSTLTGDIYNFTADEVAKIRTKNKKAELFRVMLSCQNENPKIKKFVEQIDEFRRVAAISSVSKLITKILNTTGYENTVFTYENGKGCYNNLLLFKEIAKSFEQSTSRGLSAFIGYIKRQIKNGNLMDKAMFSGESDNAVKIMTMHRSKGLQFPICIIACLDKTFNRKDCSADVILTSKCGLGLNFIDKNRKIKYSTFPRNACIIETNAVLQSEQMRLLYVAMTRAKDYLYMVASDDKLESYVKSIANEVSYESNERFNPFLVRNFSTFHQMIVAGALAHQDGSSLRELAEVNTAPCSTGRIKINVVDQVEIECDEIISNEKVELDEQKFNELSEILAFNYPYKDLNKIFVKQSASALAHKEFSSDFAFKTEPVFLHNQKLSAAEKGTAMHKFMQYCNLKDASKNIQSEITRLKNEGKLTLEEAKSLKEENLKAFFDSDIGKKLIINDNVYREQHFMIEIDANEVYNDLGEEFENEKIIIQGSADLCFLDDEGLCIIDYKTDRVDEQELIKRYKTQLDVYKIALSQTFGCKVCATAIYSFYLKKLIML